jgi:hypothetical protein
MVSPTRQDWMDADEPARMLTPLILRGIECGNPERARQHTMGVLTAYFAQEAVERRELARRIAMEIAPPTAEEHQRMSDRERHAHTKEGGCVICQPRH